MVEYIYKKKKKKECDYNWRGTSLLFDSKKGSLDVSSQHVCVQPLRIAHRDIVILWVKFFFSSLICLHKRMGTQKKLILFIEAWILREVRITQGMYFIYLFIGSSHSMWKFLGWSCNLHHSGSNTGSLTHWTRQGTGAAPPQRQSQLLAHCATAGTPEACFIY